MKIVIALILVHLMNCAFISIHAVSMLKQYEIKVPFNARIATFIHCLIHPLSNLIFLYATFSNRIDEGKIVKAIIDKKEG